MATTPPVDPRDQSFIREVDEEYRREEFTRLASRYGRWVALAVGLILAVAGGYLYWDSEQTKRNETLSEAFIQALDKVDVGASTEALGALETVAKGDNASYRALSLLTQAGIAANAADNARAAGLFRAVADDQAVPQVLRDAASLKLLRLEFDQTEPAAIIDQLARFMDGDNYWYPIAAEMTALAHMKAGENDKAAPIFYRVAEDSRTPASLASRAEQMAAMLGQDVSPLVEARQKADAARAGAMDAEAGPGGMATSDSAEEDDQ